MTPQSSSLRATLGFLIVLGLLLSPTLQTCGMGCLSCAENIESGITSCNICDIFNSYIKTFDGYCEQNVVENCLVPSLDRFSKPCVQCQSNYILDVVQGKCVSVAIDKAVPDCFQYSNVSTCVSCNPDHYISFGKCIKSDTVVTDCTHYLSEGICSQCADEQYLDKDNNTCLKYPKSPNCLSYNSLRCDECKPGYAQDLNYYLRFTPSNSNIETLASNQANFLQYSQEKDENCFKMNVLNCKVHESADACLECEPQFFVTEDRQCEAYPQNRISNCSIYSNMTTCQECEFLYKLDSNECVRRTLLDDCVTYDISNDLCVECESGYWANSGVCTVRTGPTTGCVTFTPNADTCDECDSNHILASDKTCFNKVENCDTHEVDVSNSNYEKCTLCDSDYFLENNTPSLTCTEYIHQPFCVTREQYLNECDVCASGYFKDSNGDCQVYTMDFCDQFSTTSDQCTSCIDGFKLETSTGACEVVELNNCQIPSTVDGECNTCVLGFYLDSTNLCRMRNLIGCDDFVPNENQCQTCISGYDLGGDQLCYEKLIPNCQIIDETGCTQADSGYYINEFKTCSKIVDNLANCNATNPDGLCTACDTVTTHYLEPISRYCLSRTNTSNCSTFKEDADLCLTCATAFYLKGGSCIAQNSNCKTYTPGTNDCASCETNEYLDATTKLCMPNNQTNCSSGSDPTSFGCLTCDSNYFLNSRTKLCERGYIPHCTAYGTTDLQCIACEAGTYLKNHKCIKDRSFGCETITPSVAGSSTPTVCTACHPGFYLLSGSCLIQNIANCKVFSATANECTTCNDGYYPETGNLSCIKQYQPNCVTYTDATNDCSLCENLFFVSLNACAKITEINCVISNGTTDACTLCIPGFLLGIATTAGTCIEIATPYKPVPNCRGNSTLVNGTDVCSICDDNFGLRSMYSVFSSIPPHCAQMSNTNKFNCVQCDEYYEMDSTNVGACKKADPTTLTDCIQMKVNTTNTVIATLATATTNFSCAKCIDSNKYYLSGGACKIRKNLYNCESLTQSNDFCSVCNPPFNRPEAQESLVSCYATKATGIITECSVYNKIETGSLTCLKCKAGFHLDGTTCTANKLVDFPSFLFQFDLSTIFTRTSNPENDMQTHYDTYGLCRTGSDIDLCGNTPITSRLPVLLFSLSSMSTYNYISKKHIVNTVNIASQTSVLVGTASDWHAGAEIANCGLAMGATLFFCLACDETHVSGKTEKFIDTHTYYKVTECLSASVLGLSKNYTGMGYFSEDLILEKTAFQDIYHNTETAAYFDTCDNGRIPMAYLIGVAPTYKFLFGITYSTKGSTMECIDELNSSYVVDNCQAYAFIGAADTDIPNPRFSSDQNIKCLACKPGYSGSNYGTGEAVLMPGTCTPIDNCEMGSSENTIMNACGKCKAGYGWEYNFEKEGIFQHKCIEVPDNCILYDEVILQCKICDADTVLENGKCLSKTAANCDTPALEYINYINVDFNNAVTPAITMSIFSAAYLSRSISQNKQDYNCGTCATGYFNMMNNTATSSIVCNYDKSTLVNNCYKYSGDTSNTGCVECNEGHILDESGVCHDSANYISLDNCKSSSVNKLLAGQCLICHEDYILDSTSGLCYQDSNCIELKTDNTCKACKTGSFINMQSSRCVEIDSTDICSRKLNVANGLSQTICLECRDKTLVPLMKSIGTPTQIESYECIPNYYNNSLIESPIIFEFNASSIFTTHSDLSIVIDDNEVSKIIEISSNFSTNQVCVALNKKQQNCNNFDLNTEQCKGCVDGYYLNSDNECQIGKINFCLEYENEYSCNKCESTHFPGAGTITNLLLDTHLLKARICVPYTDTLLCEEFNPISDTCLTCSPLYFLDITSYECTVYTVTNCAVFHPSLDQCLICSDGYFIDGASGNPVCTPITIANCSVYNANLDLCVSCREGFYLDNTSKCIAHTKFNCKLYSPESDACLLCPNGHYLDQGLCIESHLQGCDVSKPNEKKCSLCSSGYYYDILNSVCIPHSVLHCSVFKQLENKCLTCDISSYMNSTGDCIEYSAATNCETYHPNDDKCITCLEGFYKDQTSGLCKQYTSLACKTYNSTANSCTSCYKSFYLNTTSDFSCIPITALNCAEFSVSENKCSICFSSHYLDIGTGNCSLYSVQNCEQYHPYKDQCSTCLEGHFLDSNFNCVEYSASGCASFSVNSDGCISCENGFYFDVATFKCNRYTVENCQSFQIQADLCSSCQPGFYLISGKCELYTVTNCAKFEALTDRCIGCIEGYFFSAGNCYEYTVENCKDVELDSNNCLNCLPGHFFEYGLCFEYTAENCETYEPLKDLCLTCDNSSERIFLNADTKGCEEVTEVDECKQYSTSIDECILCNEGLFLENQVCLANPTGIPECIEYKEIDECILCSNGFYLSNNTCVEPQVPIVGCQKPSSENCCEICQSGYAPTNDLQCVVAVETSCTTYTDANNCESCGLNEVLIKDASNNMVCQNSGIQYCLNALNSVQGISCTKCEEGYFLNDTKTQCLSPTTLVQNCREYIGDGLCSRCEDMHLLSKDSTQCTNDIAQVGSQCLVGHISSKPKCNRCEGGYYFSDSGTCQKCSDNIEGCSTCDINNLSRCLICSNEYYMKDDFTCEKYPPPEEIDIGISIIKFTMIGLLAFFMIN